MKQKISISLFSILFTLLAIEITIRFFVSNIRSPQEKHNIVQPNDLKHKTIRILAIGESTTDLYWAEDNEQAWTIKLEKQLNKKFKGKYNFRVYNEGVGGTRTALILHRIEHLLNTYRPDIVISMMGINDQYSKIRYNENWINKLKVLIMELKTIKFINRFFSFYKSYDFSKKDDHIIADNYFKEAILKHTKQRDEALKEIQVLIKRYPHLTYRFNFLIAESIILNKNFGSLNNRSNKEDEKIARDYYNKSYNQTKELLKEKINSNLLVNLIQVSVETNRNEECLYAFEKLVSQNYKISNFILSRITMCYESLREDPHRSISPRIVKIYSSINIQSNNKYTSYENTVHHYRELYHKLKKRNIKYIAMGYPLVDISVLKRIFSDNTGSKYLNTFTDAIYRPAANVKVSKEYQDIIFVSNKERFEKALIYNDKSLYFNDNFAKIFGHTTPKGDSLIVKELLQVLSPLFNK